MQEMQQAVVTPRGFLQDLGTNDEVKAWANEMLSERNSSATSISRAEVLDGIKGEQRRIRRAEEEMLSTLDIGEAPTRYDLPAMPKTSPYTTEKMPALDLAQQEEIEEDEPCVTITASAEYHTIDLIHQAVEQLGSMPTLIVVSNLRHMASEKLLRRIQYHCHGVRIPIVPSDGPCEFDVKVFGSKI